MATDAAYLPITAIIQEDAGRFPSELFRLVPNPAGLTLTDDVGLTGYSFGQQQDGTRTIALGLACLEETAVGIPGLDGVDLVLNSADGGATEIEAAVTFDPFAVSSLVSAKLRFSPDILKPVTQAVENGKPVWKDDEAPCREIELGEVTVTLGAEGGLDFEGLGTLSMDSTMLGESGVVIALDEFSLRLTTNDPNNPPPTGEPDNWKGLKITSGKFYLPAFVRDSNEFPMLTMTDVRIGNGGFTGTLQFDSLGGLTLAGFSVDLVSANLEFRQNTLTGGAVYIDFKLPFFDVPLVNGQTPILRLELTYTHEGGFNVRLADDQLQAVRRQSRAGGRQPLAASSSLSVAGHTFSLDGLLELTVSTFNFLPFQAEPAIELGGSIQPLIDIGGATWPIFEIKKMTIYADGRVDLDGGWLNLPEQAQLDLYGFSAELTQFGFGETDDGYRWIGFSGGIQLAADLGLGAQFDRLRILWHADDGDDIHFALEGAAVDLTIPDVLAFHGKVRFINDTANEEKGFKGGVKLMLCAINLEIDAELLVVRRDNLTAFYIYVNSNLPAGIPLASTGVALYGLAGLLGQNVAPNKTEQESWYENWYKGERLGLDDPNQDPGVASTEKWYPPISPGSMAFGAGVTLGTAADNGFAVNGKLLFVLVIPGPTILLEGRANLLTERSKLGDVHSEPTFEALAVLDGQAGQFLLNVAAQYRKDEQGRIIDIRAGAEAFFDYHRADVWHLYLGQDEPREKRIRADVISLFHADAYFMLSARDLRMGFWVGFDERWDFGPLYAGLSAWIAADAAVSWKPVHVFGQLQLHGGFELSAFGFGLSIAVDALIAAQTPTPFEIIVALRVKLKLPWPLPDLKANVELNWGNDEDEPPYALPLGAASCEHLKASEKWPLDRLPHYDTDGDGFTNYLNPDEPPWTADDEAAQLALNYDEDDEDGDNYLGVPEVPLDVRPVLTFAKPVYDDIGFSGAREGLVEQVGDDYRFTYRLISLELHKKLGPAADWELVATRPGPNDNHDNKERLDGFWQLVNGGDDTLPNARLMLWAKTPYEWGREQAGEMYAPPILERLPEATCPPSSPQTTRCVDWDDAPTETHTGPFVRRELLFSPLPAPMDVVYRPLAEYGHLHALKLAAAGGPVRQLRITRFPYGTNQVTLRLDAPRESLSQPSQVIEAEAFYDGVSVDTESVTAGEVTAVMLTLAAAEIDEVIVRPGGTAMARDVYLYRVCYDAPLNPDRQQAADRWANGIDDANAAWLRGQVLESDTYYRLTVVTKTQLNENDDDENNNEDDDKTFTEYVYWKTGQPPGVYDSQLIDNDTTVKNQHDHFPNKGPLKDLRLYVDHTTPAPESRAVYRAYDICAYFNDDHILDMYEAAAKPLGIRLYDAKGDPVTHLTYRSLALAHLDAPDRSPARPAAQAEKQIINLTRAETQWMYTLAEAPCADAPDLANVPPDDELGSFPPGWWLRPETLYEAHLVADAGADLYTVYKWQFITSRFAHFRHHIGSFHDRVWDEHALLGYPDAPLLTEDQLRGLRTWVQAVRDGDDTLPVGDPPAYDVFGEIAYLFGFGNDPSTNDPGRWRRLPPSQVEVTLLRDGSRRYGLLLESPEPLEASRVTLSATYNDTLTPLVRSPGAAKLLNVRIGAAGDPANAEYVDILLLQDQDLSGWIIQHTNSASPGAYTFSDYYTIPSGSDFAEGTLVRVHTGRAANDPTPTPTYRHLYVEKDVCQLNRDGDRLRLVQRVDGTDQTIHSRFFLPSQPEPYNDREMIAVWNADCTIAFLFLPEDNEIVGDVPDGQLRLAFTFKRTILDQEEELPELVLRQENDTSDEQVNLDLVIGGEDYHLTVGDINQDGVVDIVDIRTLAGAWRQPPIGARALYDLNRDGIINVVDVQQAASNWGFRFDP